MTVLNLLNSVQVARHTTKQYHPQAQSKSNRRRKPTVLFQCSLTSLPSSMETTYEKQQSTSEYFLLVTGFPPLFPSSISATLTMLFLLGWVFLSANCRFIAHIYNSITCLFTVKWNSVYCINFCFWIRPWPNYCPVIFGVSTVDCVSRSRLPRIELAQPKVDIELFRPWAWTVPLQFFKVHYCWLPGTCVSCFQRWRRRKKPTRKEKLEGRMAASLFLHAERMQGRDSPRNIIEVFMPGLWSLWFLLGVLTIAWNCFCSHTFVGAGYHRTTKVNLPQSFISWRLWNSCSWSSRGVRRQ